MSLTGNCFPELVAALHAALESFSSSRCNRLRDCLVVKMIFPRLREQKDMLITTGTAIFHAFRHWVFLHPDDVVSQIPAGVTEGKCQHPRNANHVFGLAALNLVVESYRLTVSAVGVLRVNIAALIAFSGIGVRDVQPERTVRMQNAPDFGKNFGQARDVFFGRCLSANLPIHAIITQGVIWRGCHAAVDALIRQRLQDFETVTGINGVELYSYLPPIFRSCWSRLISRRNTHPARNRPHPLRLHGLPSGRRFLRLP